MLRIMEHNSLRFTSLTSSHMCISWLAGKNLLLQSLCLRLVDIALLRHLNSTWNKITYAHCSQSVSISVDFKFDNFCYSTLNWICTIQIHIDFMCFFRLFSLHVDFQRQSSIAFLNSYAWRKKMPFSTEN